MVRELLEILDFVHSQNAIHRDIKPANIIRRESDRKLVLIDFGAVKRITTGEQQKTIVISTPGYMPVEQLKGEPNFGSDIYAVGMICIQALTGIEPKPYAGGGFPTDSKLNILWQQKAQVSSCLAKIVTKMVRCDYRERYQTATQVLRDILDLAKSSDSITSITKYRKPTKQILIYGSLVAAILAGITGIKLWHNSFSAAKLPLNGKIVTGILSARDICNVLLENI